MRATRPLKCRQAHEATTQLINVVNSERQDALKNSFTRG